VTNIEKFSAKELALAMFDCINNDNQKNLVVFEDDENYEKEFQGLMQAHHEAPISGVQAMDFAAGLITFNNNSELWFSVSKKSLRFWPKKRTYLLLILQYYAKMRINQKVL
jgi:hypothetical protein